VIPLDPAFIRVHGREATESAIRRIVCSVKFEWLEQSHALRLRGPDMPYHSGDPYLEAFLQGFKQGLRIGDIVAFHSHEALFDLCFEDSWSGYFIADRIRDQRTEEAVVLIHLDDHTDMMSTLLTSTNGAIGDCMLGTQFDPAKRRDWEQSIHSGCVGIGNFITPLYYSRHRVHVRHLNSKGPIQQLPVEVFREPVRYALIPDMEFAGLRKGDAVTEAGAGTYGVATDARSILADLPLGKTVVHIDLDYLVNDFDGNARGAAEYRPDDSLALAGRDKLDRFFEALNRADCPVDRWIVGTSPGFCSALHWPWMLREIENHIAARQARA
jgi:hypothetical protein